MCYRVGVTTSGSSRPASSFHRRRPTAEDELLIERRRRLVGQWRFVEGLTEKQIHERLGQLDPPVICHPITIQRDLAILRKRFARYYGNAKEFNPVQEVAELISRYKFIALKSMRIAGSVTDVRTIANMHRTAMEAQKQLSDLLFDCGLLNRKLGSLFMFGMKGEEADAARDRIPSGTELQRLYDSIQVKDAEIISEAESAWLHGDFAAAAEPKAITAGDGE